MASLNDGWESMSQFAFGVSVSSQQQEAVDQFYLRHRLEEES